MPKTLFHSLVLVVSFACLSVAQAPQVNFRGLVESLPGSGLTGDWKVAGTTVKVTSSTSIDQERGPVGAGTCVEVRGTRISDSSIQASEIEVKPGLGGCGTPSGRPENALQFRGFVQAKPASGDPGLWQISGRKVEAGGSTRVMPTGNPPAVGSCVSVKGNLLDTGNIAAESIQGLGEGACDQGAGERDEPKLIGRIEALPSGGLTGDWKVAGNTVRVSSTTTIDTDRGAVALGGCVTVRGQRDTSQVLVARYVETEPASECDRSGIEFTGVVETMPASGLVGLWKIASQSVLTTASTTFDTEKGQPKVGACVEVRATQPATGPVVAASIEVKSVSGNCIFRGGVTNAGSYSTFAISPNLIISVFGAHIGPATQLPMAIGTDDRLANRLGSTQISFDGIPAALTFASRGQINAVVPCAVAGKTSMQVQVANEGAVSNSVTVPVAPSAPALFTLSSSGAGRAAALNYDADIKTYTENAPSNPAPRGSVVVLYGTGFGGTNVPCVDGGINRAPILGKPDLNVTATVGGKPATVNYAGDAPDLVRGVFQVNIAIPPDAASGPNVPVLVKAGDRTTQEGVTISIR